MKYVLCIDRIVALRRRRKGDTQQGLGSVDSALRAGRDSIMAVVDLYDRGFPRSVLGCGVAMFLAGDL